MKGDLVHGRRGKLQKDKVASGRLIVKKKGDETSTAVSSAKQKGLYSKKEKKRKQVPTDSESDEDLLVSSRRKVACGATRGSNGSAASKNSTLDYSKSKGDFGSDRKKTRSEQIKLGDDAQSVMNRFPEDDFESKRSRLDVFEYTDDPIVDTKKLNKEAIDGDAIDTSGHCILSLKSREPSSRRRELGNDVSRSTVVEKRRKTVFGSSSFLAEQEQETDCLDEKNKFEGNTVSTLRKKSRNSGDDTIRLPGKNGVLKVMIKNKKEVLGSGKPYSYQETEENGNDSESGDTSIWNTPLYPLYLKNKSRDEPGSSVTKNQLNMQKFSQAEDINALSKLDLKEMDLTSTKKGVKSKGKKNIKDEIPSPMLKEGRGKCSSTKKQLLRNQIQDMLLGAGWTIDRRPRRNRNYFDSVYINPTGTGYWSIVNAYEALKREYEDKNSGSESGRTKFYFSPIPDEVLATLTRQTRKKIEKEKKQKLKSKKGSKGVEEAMELQKRSAKNKHFLKGAWRSKDGGKIRSVFKNASKFPKGRLKDNDAETLLHEESNSSAISHKGMPKSVRSQKSSSHLLPGKKKKKSSGYALLVRGSHTGVNSDGDDFIPFSGKRTVLSWLIDSGTVPLSGKVQYKNKRRTRVMLEGWITPDGIHCGCCSKIVTVSKFEIHAGSKLRQPFQNIFVESGISLLQCQLDAWNRQEDSERRGFHFVDFDGDDPNDDTCGICGDGGDLICCDGCPSTFHQSCLGIQMLPAGDWHCPNCSCRFCGGVGSSIVQKDPVTTSAIPKCGLCEKKYHQLCAGETEAELVDTNNPHSNFCGFKCKQIFEQLQKLLGVKHELEDGISWTLVQRCDLDSDLSPRVLPQRAECNSKLAVALAVMDECFLPIVDRRSGINLIHNVLYSSGSNFNRLSYCGFYTIILERGDEIISAASIRIHGTRLAEMPFIGTRHIYRRQGMCRRLLNTIESVLCSLNVEKLIIPAISELMHTWTVVFGFKPLEELHKQEMRSMNMLVFPGADLLQKFLLKYELSEGNVSAVEVVEPIMVQSSCNRPKAATVYDRGCVAEPDVAASDEGVVRDDQEKNEVSAVGSGFQDNGGSSHDTSDVMQGPLDGPASVNVCASDEDVVCDSQVKIDEAASVRSGFENISGLSHDTSDSMCNPSDDPGQPMCQAFKERTTSYKLAEGSVDSASLHSCPTKDEPVEGKKPLLDSAMACPTQSSSEGEQDCFLEVKLDVADTKPAKTGLCSLEEISLQKTTEIIE